MAQLDFLVCANTELHTDRNETFPLGGEEYHVILFWHNGVRYKNPKPEVIRRLLAKGKVKVGFSICRNCQMMNQDALRLIGESQK